MLSSAVTDTKIITSGEIGGDEDGLTFSHCSMQGWRKNQEDAEITCASPTTSIFGVLDGHGGSSTSLNGAVILLETIQRRIIEHRGVGLVDFKKVFSESFVEVDEKIRDDSLDEGSGCTVNVVAIDKDMISCGNAGDSRAVLCCGGKAIDLSYDHKPTDREEAARIRKAGGSVLRGRVGGIVAVSRALGDYAFKVNKELGVFEQQICCKPDVTVRERSMDEDEFIVIACDGIWDVIDSAGVVRYVRTRLQADPLIDLNDISKGLLDYCLGRGSKDNMTIIIVLFKNGVKLLREEGKRGGCCLG